MEIHWVNLLIALKAMGIMAAFVVVSAVIGIPIWALGDWWERHHTPGEIGKQPDWEIIIMFGTFLGFMIVGLLLLCVLIPQK